MANQSKPRVLPDLNTLAARLEALEAENAKLREANEASTKVPTVTIEDYQGKPVLHFQNGNFRPFHMGLGKFKVLKMFEKEIDTFIKTNGKKV
jgi:hypothetical protein